LFLLSGSPDAETFIDERQQLAVRERLAQRPRGAEHLGHAKVIDIAQVAAAMRPGEAARHGDDRRLLRGPPQFPDRLEPFLVGHEDVGDHEIEGLLLETPQAVVAVDRELHVMASHSQHRLDGSAHEIVVINYEYSGHLSPSPAERGSRTNSCNK